MYCKHCGKEISDDSRFCRFCGKLLIGETGETIGARRDAYKGIDIKGTAAVGGGQIIQIEHLHQLKGEDRTREIFLSATKENVDEVDQLFNEPLGTPDTYLKLGSFEFVNENYEKAVEYFDNIIKIDITNSVAWMVKGITLERQRRYDDAIRCCDKALEIDPRAAHAWITKGLALGKLEKYDAEIRCYDEALNINPKDISAQSMKGFAFCNLEKFDDAIRCCDEALDIYPGDELAKSIIEHAKRKKVSKII